MGFFTIDQDLLRLSREGWIYLACTLPLTFVVLGGSFAWIWWTDTKVKKPSDCSCVQILAEATTTLSLGIAA